MSNNAIPPPTPPKFKGAVTVAFFVGDVGFSVMTAATGALGIGGSDSINDSAVIFVGLYLILFAAILVGYEIAQFKPASTLDNIMKKNVGFLYGPIGKSIYIMFMGLLSFGITSPRSLAIATGVLVGVWGLLQLAVANLWPGYFDKKEKYVPQF